MSPVGAPQEVGRDKTRERAERTQGFAADPVYVKGEVFAYVGLPQNLKDLKLGGTESKGPKKSASPQPCELAQIKPWNILEIITS